MGAHHLLVIPLCAGYGSLPKNTKREFKLFPFFQKASKYLRNPNFKGVEFDHFRKEAGLPTFTMSVSNWIEKTGAIGIVSKAGRYGGTYAHKDIAFEFCSAISPMFKLYVIKEYQRLVELERSELALS